MTRIQNPMRLRVHPLWSVILFFVLFPCLISAQPNHSNNRLDSLKGVWANAAAPPIERLNAVHLIAWEEFDSQPDSAIRYAQMQFDLAQKVGDSRAMALALNTLGFSHFSLSNYRQGLNNHLESYELYKKLDDKSAMANALVNIAGGYAHMALYPQALDYYQKSLKLAEESGNKNAAGRAVGNIGFIYSSLNDDKQALDYFQRSLQIREEIGDSWGITGALVNIGNIYMRQKKYPEALDCFERSLTIREQLGNANGIAGSLLNIGTVYQARGDHAEAMKYYTRSYAIRDSIGDKKGAAGSLFSMGTLENERSNPTAGIKWCEKAMYIVEQIESPELERNICQCLYDGFKAMGKDLEALSYLEKISELDRRMQTDQTTKKLEQMEFAKIMLRDSIAKAEEARLIEMAHLAEVEQKNRTRNWLVVSSLFLLIVAGGLYSRWRYVRKSRDIIAKEKERSENLLLNILPADVAEELKQTGRAQARNYDMVSILFTDFKGFTEVSSQLNAQDLVNEINVCFEAFDQIVVKYGIEKIKTIGDAYMAAGGLPVPTEDSVKNTVLAALEMQQFIAQRKIQNEAEGKPAFQMRIGIHTGPVVAGIVGIKKFQYDIWGDTVNTASRMESNGEPGKVNISESTFERLRDRPEFRFESRGKIAAKGKGEMDMYFVESAPR